MALPWLDPLPDADGLRATDAWAIERLGIAGFALMETAGARLADAVTALVPEGPVAIVCGAGNNGGDGYVAARRLRAAGRPLRVLSTVPDERLRGDAALARDGFGGAAEPWDPAALEGAAVIVDAILGTGATGAPRGLAADAIAAIARAAGEGVPVIACDVPSGVDATTGEVAGAAVPATETVSFHAATSGLWIAPGKGRVGRLRVVDIGIPAAVSRALPAPAAGLLTERVLDGLPVRGAEGTKFRSGHVLVVGGAPGMTGAPCLTARGAMRAGAGYVTLAAAAGIEPLVASRAPLESLTLPLPEAPDGGAGAAAAAVVLERLGGRGGTLVVGPGLGRHDERGRLVRELAAGAEGPLVVDADGLAALAGDPEALAGRSAATVLTPHAGELGRLLDRSSDEIGAQRLAAVREAARRSGAVVVLKGDDTLIADPAGRVAISPGGAPGLATAGTGDVLAGVVGALLARGNDPLRAAAAAVWLHLLAGRRSAERHGADGTVAGDVAEAVAAVRRDHERGAAASRLDRAAARGGV
ncbi:NAD(P)H-hydrate dehydratase [Patulibacter defluvii]|uniref:NAD(P)H-hydrate dehydratase n=1 Tax=Patulibacter defluvii TaxID=3095358 RepID=UPI002A764622|nr:NAD(P)H-hydrate dehydratase [Patulibacter sp. DM4]